MILNYVREPRNLMKALTHALFVFMFSSMFINLTGVIS